MADDHDDDAALTDRERELKKWSAPYVPQDYPRMLYRCATDPAGHIEQERLTVQSAGEEQEAHAAGWVRKPDEAEAAEQARQEAIIAARQEQQDRKLAEMLSRMLDEREERRKSQLPPSQAVDQGAEPRAAAGPPGVSDDRPPLKLPEAAKKLGMSVASLKRRGAEGKIMILKLGPKTLRVAEAEVERALRSPEFQKYQFPDRDR